MLNLTKKSRSVRKAAGVRWTRIQSLIALNLYCKLPFGKMHKGNSVIKEVAAKMGRTPSSLVFKLTNFASLDPILQARGIVGMRGATNEDRALWREFHSNLATLGPESEQLLHDLITNNAEKEVDLLEPDKIRLEPSSKVIVPHEQTEGSALVKVRRGQQFFRQSILSAYGVRCCVSGINVPRLLVASHIKPWRDFPKERLSPYNGLCLSTIHDAAFDAGLITFDENLNLLLSRHLRSYFPQPALEHNFTPFEGEPMRLPKQLAEPSRACLAYHRETIFQG